ncbi:DinB family protein [Dyadobacter aurulentus]|uniref:DinB family protein n=1 Tax=Dyadobacter sp. UC 10 TaxID=2605428 RepID=UPI0011F21582|nr:DinB family protein [Dyadobacter sp. UC 10]KAA0993670.1 DinB family protein [Dyadobacter sp. UC 10]
MEKHERGKLAEELTMLIEKGNAHVSFWDAIGGLPAQLRGAVPKNLPYSIWQLVEHLRITQKDILEFSESEAYQEKEWPKDYWTPALEQIDEETWENSLAEIREDQQQFIALLRNEENDLFTPFSWGEGQSLLREAMLIADHNSYHTAEIVVIRRLLNAWK